MFTKKRLEQDFTRQPNPYAQADGSPIEGKEKEFFDFEIRESQRYYDSLTEEEQREYDIAAKELQKRMDS